MTLLAVICKVAELSFSDNLNIRRVSIFVEFFLSFESFSECVKKLIWKIHDLYREISFVRFVNIN